MNINFLLQIKNLKIKWYLSNRINSISKILENIDNYNSQIENAVYNT